MKIAIIQFPGSNCERETAMAVSRAGMQPVDFLWNADPIALRACDGYVIVGGFSYEDRGRAGLIASLDPVMQVITQESEKGKPVLGICNGAQILVETGLVPGIQGYPVAMALAENKRLVGDRVLGTGYYNDWIHMKATPSESTHAFTRHLDPEHPLTIPVAHAEGRFILPTALWETMQAAKGSCFHYCDEVGAIHPEFPTNPNGSFANLAAVSNQHGNVMAMMPHPERTPLGDPIFASMRDYLEQGYEPITQRFTFENPSVSMTPYALPANAFELIVALNITDNVAVSMQTALQQAGIPVTLNRFVHYEVGCSTDAALRDVSDAVIKSNELFNPSKERLIDKPHTEHGFTLLIRPREDVIGQRKLAILRDHFGLDQLTQITRSILWEVTAPEEHRAAVEDTLRSQALLFNPYAHECYDYV